MKNLCAVIVAALMFSAATARAEHKLLVTEVLDPGQLEGQASFEYTHGSARISVGGEKGKAYTNLTESRYFLNAGVVHGLEIDASIPYVFSEQLKAQVAGESEYEKRDGFGDVVVGAKYRLLDEHAPFALVVGCDVKLDTAPRNDAGTGTTDVSPYIAASKKVGHHDTPYAIYRYNISNHGVADTHTLTAGLEHEFNENITLDLRADAAFQTASPTLASNEAYTLEAASYLQVARNLYVIPSVAVILSSPTHSKVEEVRAESGTDVRGGLSLYYLY